MNSIILNQRITFTMPKGTISDEGVRLIENYIATHDMRKDAWKGCDPFGRIWLPQLPEDWQWVWIVESGEYRGKFARRVEKYYATVHSIRLPRFFVERIGNIAREHSSEGVTYSFDFVTRFDWIAGQFGDLGSCYWGSYNHSRILLQDNGGMAIRFFNAIGGYARAWIVEVHSELFVVFNGYGLNTVTIAYVLATYLNLSYRSVDLTNFGSETDTIYINGGRGVLVGTPDEIADYDHFDLGIYDPDYTDDLK